MSAKSIDLNALMFSPNFDEYPDETDSLAEEEFRFPFRVFWAGIILGSVISGTVISKIYTLGNSIQIDLSHPVIMVFKFFS
jgi:hypothetical protein